MKPLHDDQIHTPAFQKECDYIWSDDVSRSDKSGVWDYFKDISEQLNKPLADHTNMPPSGVIFVGMCHLLESVFQSLPTNGNYIIIHRTNDRPFTQEMYNVKPPSVKHIYTVDSRVYAPDVSAIPFGLASINGEDNLIKQIVKGRPRKVSTRLFCCYNTNPSTPHRNASIPALQSKSFAKVFVPSWPDNQMPGDEFYRQVKAHEFTMALAGCGADASRQWAALTLGSIPIVTDCLEMRHFEDMPLVFCPASFDDITEDWLNTQSEAMKNKSTYRMRMSYWQEHIKITRENHSI